LCEKNERLGGVLRCEENVAFKKNLDYYLNQQAKCVEEDDNIELCLQTKVTPEYAEDLNADVIIAALGAQAARPQVPGIDRKEVLSAQEA
ncbi:hypothetical protein LI003_22940, partial [Bacteroides caccae]